MVRSACSDCAARRWGADCSGARAALDVTGAAMAIIPRDDSFTPRLTALRRTRWPKGIPAAPRGKRGYSQSMGLNAFASLVTGLIFLSLVAGCERPAVDWSEPVTLAPPPSASRLAVDSAGQVRWVPDSVRLPTLPAGR